MEKCKKCGGDLIHVFNTMTICPRCDNTKSAKNTPYESYKEYKNVFGMTDSSKPWTKCMCLSADAIIGYDKDGFGPNNAYHFVVYKPEAPEIFFPFTKREARVIYDMGKTSTGYKDIKLSYTGKFWWNERGGLYFENDKNKITIPSWYYLDEFIAECLEIK